MKLSGAAGEEEEKRTSPKAGSITAEPLNWEWAKPLCLRRQRGDLQLHPATVNTRHVSIQIHIYTNNASCRVLFTHSKMQALDTVIILYRQELI